MFIDNSDIKVIYYFLLTVNNYKGGKFNMGPVFKIAIKAPNGHYLRHNADDSLSFENCDVMDPEVQFFVPIGTNVFLHSYKRHSISLNSNNSLSLAQSNMALNENSLFSAVFLGANRVAVKASNNMFVNYNSLSATSNSIGNNETFEIIHLYI
jgi:hypothetical protein